MSKNTFPYVKYSLKQNPKSLIIEKYNYEWETWEIVIMLNETQTAELEEELKHYGV